MEYKSHILVVDDEPQVRDLVATVLRHEGYLVETAESGRQALIMLADNSFDLIVTDLMMSEVSGFDVLAEVKVRWPATEVILITAHATLGSAVDALRHGAYDYLSKPFSSHDLLLSIRRASAYHQLKLEKENLLTRLQQRVRTRNALVKAAQQIATVLDQTEVIHTILEAAFDVLPEVDLAAVCYKSAESQLIIRGMNNERVEVATLPFDEDLISRVLGQRQTVYYPTWATPALARENSIEVRKESLIIEPLIQAGSTLGALVIISQKPDAFDEDLRQLLTMLATQAAIAMQNAQLYTEARRVDELEALYEAGRIINRTLDLQETLSATLAITRSLTGATVGHVYFYAPEHQRLTSVITSGDELTLTDADRRQSADIALRLLADYHTDNSTVGQKVTIIRTPSADAAGDEVEKYGIQSWLAVPLIRDGDLAVSVLELGSEKVDAFTADDVRLVQVIIGQATTAIENSRLYEEVRLRLRQTEALGTISQSISNTLDLRRVFDLVVHAATKTIPVTTHSWLYLLDEESACFVLEAQAVKQSVLASTGLEAYRRQVIQQAAQLQSPVRQVWLDDEQTPWSLLVAPLKVNEKVIGAISVESPRSDAFLSGDEILLNAFANHASIAIQNANLFRELSSAYRDLAYHQAEILRSHKTLQALFDGITDGLYIVDQDMRIIAINEAEASRWDKSPEALVGQSCDATLWSLH
jgi:GAF domain-containing protein